MRHEDNIFTQLLIKYKDYLSIIFARSLTATSNNNNNKYSSRPKDENKKNEKDSSDSIAVKLKVSGESTTTSK